MATEPTTETDQTKKLTPKQELFCQYYASPGRLFGNGVQCYIEAYGIDIKKNPGAYNSARTCAYELLTRLDIVTRTRELMDLGPMNEATVDKELYFAIAQDGDMKAKVSAIAEFNKVKGRIVSRADITSKGKRISGITPEVAAALNKAAGHDDADD